jgi:hypothetical protein
VLVLFSCFETFEEEEIKNMEDTNKPIKQFIADNVQS